MEELIQWWCWRFRSSDLSLGSYCHGNIQVDCGP